MSRQGVAQRLPRLLSLVPYLRAHPGVQVAVAAADFGVEEKQLRKDLELLWMCGLPGYGPGDLVDLSFAGDTVDVVFDAGLTRPLRLTTSEATALLVALRMLHQTPGVVDSAAVARAIGKIETAVGVAGETAGPAALDGVVTVEPGSAERATTAVVRRALDRGRALRIVYFTAGRDAVSRRDVDPMRLVVAEGRGYLEAWCRRAEGVRMFRLDRVEQAEELDEPALPHPDARPTDVSQGLFGPREGQRHAVLELEPGAHWVAEYYPVDDVAVPDTRDDPAPGRIRVLLRFADPDWLVRLVLGLGGAARILEPADLAGAVRARAREALDRSARGGGGGPVNGG
ncbi:helix-turn-helix transcriptional regulator [Pseudonocardia sp. HH130630-07]|uniref:helix-turn-helix transcriptional regulator n=1 Tax=Pseudonocardia sp. HH130630-07 TaxID=1690815 RepID=UPI000814F36B|nr:YafY family protein [Pseudonocardia sp. HH130630-07]ANY09133.1 protein pafC [Pseudonocardia sp. HH130630-07]